MRWNEIERKRYEMNADINSNFKENFFWGGGNSTGTCNYTKKKQKKKKRENFLHMNKFA